MVGRLIVGLVGTMVFVAAMTAGAAVRVELAAFRREL